MIRVAVELAHTLPRLRSIVALTGPGVVAPTRPGSRCGRRVDLLNFLVVAVAAATATAAAKDGEEDQRAHAAADADYYGFVVVDPAGDFVADAGTCAAALEVMC